MKVKWESGGAGGAEKGDGMLKKAALFFVGFSLLLTLRVGLNGASFCLKRFRLDEGLYSQYVSRVHNAMELGCFLGVLAANAYVLLCGWQLARISIAVNWAFFLVNVALLWVFVAGGSRGHLTLFYWTLVGSAFVYGLNQVCVFKMAGGSIVFYLAAFPISGIFVSMYQFFFVSRFGDRRLYETDFLIIVFQIGISIFITVITAALWTLVFLDPNEAPEKRAARVRDVEAQAEGAAADAWYFLRAASPIAMSVVGLGLVYMFYPGIAPGLLVKFEVIHTVDLVVMFVGALPSLVVAVLSEMTSHGPNRRWAGSNGFWHLFLVFPVLEALCGVMFFRVLHYRSTVLSRIVLGRPVVAGALSVLFFASHAISIGVGLAGIEPNSNSSTATVALLMGLLTMNLLEFLGEGYVIEFKKLRMGVWPTAGMSDLDGFLFWLRSAWHNSLRSLASVPTRDLRRDLLISWGP